MNNHIVLFRKKRPVSKPLLRTDVHLGKEIKTAVQLGVIFHFLQLCKTNSYIQTIYAIVSTI